MYWTFFSGFVVLAQNVKYFVYQHNLQQISKILIFCLKNDILCIVLIQQIHFPEIYLIKNQGKKRSKSE